MEHQKLEGRSCPEQHPDHPRRPNLGQQSRRLHGKGVANSQKKVMPHSQQAVARSWKEQEACSWEEAKSSWEGAKSSWKEATCSWKEWDL